MEKKSILDEKETLKELHITLIQVISFTLKLANQNPANFANYYQIINFYRDIDFCLKVYATLINSNFTNKKINIVEEIITTLSISEQRYAFYAHYLNRSGHN